MQESINSQRRGNGRWTQEQHLTFLEGLRIHGKNWKKIEQLLKTRTGTQIRSHAQKFFMKIGENDSKNKQKFSQLYGGDFLEKQSLTDNTKITNIIEVKPESSSYFLNKILQHSNENGVSNFWSALVESKKQKEENKQHSIYRHSFENYKTYPAQIRTVNSNPIQ